VVSTSVAATVAATAAVSGEGMFAASIVTGVAYVSLAIARFISLEVVETLRAALGEWAVVTVARVKAVVDVAVEAVRSVEPRTSTKEDAANKPVGAVVAIGGAIVGSVVEVAVGAYRWHSNVDADGNLGRPQRRTAEQGNCKS